MATKPGAIIAAILCISAQAAEIESSRIEQLKEIVKHDCGSCHGMTMKGGLGPPLTVNVFDRFPHEYYVQVILNGKPSTPMPPWKKFFSYEEASWIVDYLKKGMK